MAANMDARIRTRGVALATLLLSSAATVTAHEHHMNKIVEGEYVSDDPIVRHQRGRH